MKLYNINNRNKQVNFVYAIKHNFSGHRGFFFPADLPIFSSKEINELLNMKLITRSTRILSACIGNELSIDQIFRCVASSFNFSAPVLVSINHNISISELFHGPTLSFMDYGCRFLAQMLVELNSRNEHIIILTTTSGNFGAAIAHAFYRLKNIQVVILYPYEKVSLFQEKLFCTLGENIHTLAVNGDFDVCQILVKKIFNDELLNQSIKLNLIDFINIGYLLGQVCCFFEIIAQLSEKNRKQLVISIPSGNCSNLTAGLLAKSFGLPIKRFIIANNANNFVPYFLNYGIWKNNPIIETLSCSLNIRDSNSWLWIEEFFRKKKWQLNSLYYGYVNEKTTIKTMRKLRKIGYISEPNAAVSYNILQKQLQEEEFGLFIGTVHPIKHQKFIEKILKQNILIPNKIIPYKFLPLFSKYIQADYNLLRRFILEIIK